MTSAPRGTGDKGNQVPLGGSRLWHGPSCPGALNRGWIGCQELPIEVWAEQGQGFCSNRNFAGFLLSPWKRGNLISASVCQEIQKETA